MFKYDLGLFLVGFLFSGGVFVFCSMRKHLLVTLLSLEYMVLCIYLSMMYLIMGCIGDSYIILLFLTFSVCEGVLGLSILVSLIRCHGNDQIGSLFFSKW